MVVQADNQDLVRRMIRPKSSSKGRQKRVSRNSLHSTYFKHVAERIEQDNAVFICLCRNWLRDCTGLLLVLISRRWKMPTRGI